MTMQCSTRPASTKPYDHRKCRQPINDKLLALMTKAGWNNGFLLPFSNEENKLLEQQLEHKQRQILVLTSALQDDTEHVEELKKHFARIQYDINVTQNLISAKRSEIMSEKNATCFAHRILHRVNEDKKTTLDQVKNYQERTGAKLEKVEKRKEIVEELMKLTEFSGKALEKWREKTEGGEREIMDIEKFQKIDSTQEIELRSRQVELSSKGKQLQLTLDNKVMLTSDLQEQFSRLSAEFRSTHRQRKELIDMWNKSIHAMKKRDQDMSNVGEEYYGMRELIRDLEKRIQEREATYIDARRSTKESKFMKEHTERKISEFRHQLSKIQSDYELVNDQQSTCRAEVQKITLQLRDLENKICRLEQFDELRKKAARSEAENIVLESRFQEINGDHQNSKQLVSQLEGLLDKQEEFCQETEEQLKNYRQFIWERYSDKTELEHELQLREKRIHNCETSIGFYITEDNKNDEMITRMKGSLYYIELHASQLHARISKMTQESLSNNYFEMQNKVIQHKEFYQQTLQDRHFISKEIEHDELALNRIERTISSGIEIQKSLQTRLNNLEIECRITNKYFQDMEQQLKDQSVEVSMHKLMLKRLVSQQTEEQESICNLTQHRYTTEGALKERKIEIETHIALNECLRKSLKEATAVLRNHVADIQKNIAVQKSRFEEISDMLKVVNESKENGDGQFPTFSQRLIACVRERELLQAEKSNWVVRVEEAEGELVGLKNTVELMNTANCAFKYNLAPAAGPTSNVMAPAEPDSQEYEQMKELETAEKFSLLRRHQAKKVRGKLREKKNDTLSSISVTKQQIRSLSFVCNAKMRLASMLSNELIVQKDKIARSNTLTQKLLVELKPSMQIHQLELIQKDLKFRFLKEKLEFAVVMVEKLVSLFPPSKETILRFVERVQQLREIKVRIMIIGIKGYKNNSRHAHHFNTDTYTNFVNELQRREMMSSPPPPQEESKSSSRPKYPIIKAR